MASTVVITPTTSTTTETSVVALTESATSTRQMDPTNLKTYLHRLAEKCAPGLRISDESMVITNAVCLALVKRIVRTADAIVIVRGNQRLSIKEIQTAAVCLNDSSLVLQANLFATEAVNRYDPSILNRPERGSGGPANSAESSPAQSVGSTSSTSSSPASSISTGERRKSVSRSSRAHLTIDVARVDAMIRALTQSDRISEGTPVYLAAFIEHITAELLRAAATVVVIDKIHTIKARHIITAIQSHAELKRLNAEWLLCEATTESDDVADSSH
jgi:histone H3/H4